MAIAKSASRTTSDICVSEGEFMQGNQATFTMLTKGEQKK